MTPDDSNDSSSLCHTQFLLERVRSGDRDATDDLMARYRDRLERFIHARLPRDTASWRDTQDVAQDVLLRCWKSLDRFEYRGVGSFWHYLRTIARNQVIQASQRITGRQHTPLPESSSAGLAASAKPMLEQIVTKEQLDKFDEVVGRFEEKLRDAILLRIECDMTYSEIAKECGYESGDAARMAIKRGIEKIGRLMLGEEDA